MDFPVVGHRCLLLLFVLPFLAVAETKVLALDFVHYQANYLVDKIPGKKLEYEVELMIDGQLTLDGQDQVIWKAGSGVNGVVYAAMLDTILPTQILETGGIASFQSANLKSGSADSTRDYYYWEMLDFDGVLENILPKLQSKRSWVHYCIPDSNGRPVCESLLGFPCHQLDMLVETDDEARNDMRRAGEVSGGSNLVYARGPFIKTFHENCHTDA
ncbi:hypothetical protein AAG906_012649 [Vitis piasezkii]